MNRLHWPALELTVSEFAQPGVYFQMLFSALRLAVRQSSPDVGILIPIRPRKLRCCQGQACQGLPRNP